MPGHHHLSMQLRLVHSYTLLPSSHIHGRLAETISLVVRDATSAGPAPALLSTLQTEPPLNPPENRENTAEIFFEVRKAFSRFSRDLASRQRCPCQIRTSSLLSVPPPAFCADLQRRRHPHRGPGCPRSCLDMAQLQGRRAIIWEICAQARWLEPPQLPSLRPRSDTLCRSANRRRTDL